MVSFSMDCRCRFPGSSFEDLQQTQKDLELLRGQSKQGTSLGIQH